MGKGVRGQDGRGRAGWRGGHQVRVGETVTGRERRLQSRSFLDNGTSWRVRDASLLETKMDVGQKSL